MLKKKNFIITTSADRPITEIAKALADAGITVNQILDEIRVITISADDAAVQRIGMVPGVVDVAPTTDIDIGPPDSPGTW